MIKICVSLLVVFSVGDASAETWGQLGRGKSLVVCNDSLVGEMKRAVEDLNYRLLTDPIRIANINLEISSPYHVSGPSFQNSSSALACVTVTKD